MAEEQPGKRSQRTKRDTPNDNAENLIKVDVLRRHLSFISHSHLTHCPPKTTNGYEHKEQRRFRPPQCEESGVNEL